jgi:chemotaxis protein methyltransferase CheR
MTSPPFDFDYLRQLVRTQSGVVLEADKDYLVTLHLSGIASQHEFESIAALVEHLKQSPFNSLHIQTIDALVNHETSFFRDRHPFDTVQSSILPELIQSYSGQHSINIWSAACSTGQEPYSMAMLIRETFPDLKTGTIRLIASDFSKIAVAQAQQGQYTQLETSRGLPSALRDRYFQPVGQAWQIIDEIRQMVEFRHLNLIHSWIGLPKIDIILLRNVLIYFDIDTKRSILNKIQRYLQKDGYLFLGGGETTFYLDSRFEAIHEKTSLYYRLRDAS